MTLALWLGSVETAEAFDINVSFQVLFMIIIGGLGSMMGSFVGAAFIILMPIVLTNVMVGSLGNASCDSKAFRIHVLWWFNYLLFDSRAPWNRSYLADNKGENENLAVSPLSNLVYGI